jgi:hypothetical protein
LHAQARRRTATRDAAPQSWTTETRLVMDLEEVESVCLHDFEAILSTYKPAVLGRELLSGMGLPQQPHTSAPVASNPLSATTATVFHHAAVATSEQLQSLSTSSEPVSLWDRLGGLRDAKDQLSRLVLLPFRHRTACMALGTAMRMNWGALVCATLFAIVASGFPAHNTFTTFRLIVTLSCVNSVSMTHAMPWIFFA